MPAGIRQPDRLEVNAMYHPLFTNWLSGYDCFSRTLTGMLRKQYEWLRMQQQLGMRMWTVMSPAASPSASTTARLAPNGGALEAKALERLERGLAPPREIYDVQNRGRIDWTRVPEWAQPADPDAFEGCAHEG
jgi:hypothetical protein